ncbi:hypothetical protein CBS63078_8227 [Aspergillus niger]|nr:hypothetical protein CBS115989_7817 [Aspergillus niger]KAI2825643.1 hypothetical protein CBS133816_8289 [Aspergillus niger]KAI2836098.1 hypothetical protein CBS11232_10289 [Aspergillus niger]KAI2843668.1 hypothetical protein CBS11350_5157 [Aspergillus niger]KAI2852497.1 hypothetical protein CBS12448_8303 [Aspergillus niger]
MRQSTGRRDRSDSSALFQTGDLRFPRTFPLAQSEIRLLSPLLKEYLRDSLPTRDLTTGIMEYTQRLPRTSLRFELEVLFAIPTKIRLFYHCGSVFLWTSNDQRN